MQPVRRLLSLLWQALSCSPDIRAEDVTGEFVDIRSHLTALRESEKRILKMLSQANTLEMVLRLERERVGNTPKRN